MRLPNEGIPTIQVFSAENALTCECGDFDESTGASYVENDHCYCLGSVSRTAEGFSETGGRFRLKRLSFVV